MIKYQSEWKDIGILKIIVALKEKKFHEVQNKEIDLIQINRIVFLYF